MSNRKMQTMRLSAEEQSLWSNSASIRTLGPVDQVFDVLSPQAKVATISGCCTGPRLGYFPNLANQRNRAEKFGPQRL